MIPGVRHLWCWYLLSLDPHQVHLTCSRSFELCGWHPSFEPHMFVQTGLWHMCTWHEIAPAVAVGTRRFVVASRMG